jgi:ABC-type phosphate transport system substrate-binding protein
MHKLISAKIATTLMGAALVLAAAPALAEVVAVVGAKSPAATMNNEQVAQFFLGKSNTMTPIDQPEGSPLRNEFYKKVADKDASQAKALWSKLVFTGKATPPKEVAGSAEVKKAVAADPKAIGYIEKSAVDATVKVVLTAP